MNPLPLEGTRVLDLSRLLPGPYCTSLLADLGAEVIKIETPIAGDYARTIPAEFGGSTVFETVNRNKKSLALNYRNPRGKEILFQLAGTCDVLIETFRPGAVKRWGIGYDAVSQVNPRLVYCSLSGYGQTGPHANRAGHDLNYAALGGLLAVNGAADGPPLPMSVPVADLAGGMLAAIAILSALVGRQSTGRGAYLDVAMIDAVTSWLAPVIGSLYAATGRNPRRGKIPLAGGLPCYNVYAAADDRYLSLAALEGHFWTAFCNTLERGEWIPRQFDYSLSAELAELFRQRTRDEWLELLRGMDVCVEPVNEMDEVMRHPQWLARGLVTPQATLGAPFRFTAHSDSMPAPHLGQHTVEVLARLGFSDQAIQELGATGIIRTG